MGASRRVSRGFHRLGLFLAAIPLIVGALVIAWMTQQSAKAIRQHQALVCAHDYLVRERLLISDDEMKQVKAWEVPWQMYEHPAVDWTFREGSYNKDWKVKLKQIGCSDWEYETVSYGEARNPSDFNWLNELAIPLALSLAITLAVYGVVRAIGWVTGGFAA
jgi:hypothetical protein